MTTKQTEEAIYNKWALIIIGAIVALVIASATLYQNGYNAGNNQTSIKTTEAARNAAKMESEDTSTAN